MVRINAVHGVMCVVIGLAAGGTAFAQAPANVAPSVRDRQVVSLSRLPGGGRVVTHIRLSAQTTSEAPLTLTVNQPENGLVVCEQELPPARAMACVYEPREGFSGTDVFTYFATQNGASSQPARVEVDVRGPGLRWEFETAGTTSLTSDATAGALPDVLGANSEDLRFSLSWQLASPRQQLLHEPAFGTAGPMSPAVARGLGYRRGGTHRVSRSANVVVRAALTSRPVTTTVQDRGAVSADATPATEPPAVVAMDRRQFSTEAEFNLNGVLDFNGTGTFLEFGALGTAAVDVGLGAPNDLTVREGRILTVLGAKETTTRWELGLRLAVKQDHDGMDQTLRVAERSTQAYRPSAIADLLSVELALTRDNRMKGLGTTGDGASENRGVLR